MEESKPILSELPRTVVLTHFCEQHGPSIVFTTQMIGSSSECYTFPKSFHQSKEEIPRMLREKRTQRVLFCFNQEDMDDGTTSQRKVGKWI